MIEPVEAEPTCAVRACLICGHRYRHGRRVVNESIWKGHAQIRVRVAEAVVPLAGYSRNRWAQEINGNSDVGAQVLIEIVADVCIEDEKLALAAIAASELLICGEPSRLVSGNILSTKSCASK